MFGLVALQGGCATYHSRPLPKQALLQDSMEILAVNANKLLNKAGTYKLNPSDGLDMTEIAILAVLNNPVLKAKRAERDVASAQVFSAGLLPDPQFAANLDHPTGNAAGIVNAWGLGLGYDIIPLITRQANIDTQRGNQAKVRLQILWQEWQVIQQAKTLAVQFRLEEKQLALLQDMRSLYKERYQHSARGLNEGNVTLDINGTDLTALLDTLSQISQLEQTHNQTRHDISLLLGLRANAVFSITKLPAERKLDKATIESRLNKLPEIRPDLLALKAGYQAQESRVRAAILAQFPSFGIGISRARDTGSLYTSGFNISLNLPFFSGNRGNIAIERATRKQLFQEYQARLVQTNIDVAKLLNLQTIIAKQRANLDLELPKLQSLVEPARKAYQQGDINALTFLNMEYTLLNKRLEQISLQQIQWKTRIAIETLTLLGRKQT